MLIEDFDLVGFVAGQSWVNVEADETLDGKAGTEGAEIVEGAEEEAGADEEQKGQRNLRDDQGFLQASLAAATNYGAGLLFQRAADVGPGGLQGGDEAEGDSGD